MIRLPTQTSSLISHPKVKVKVTQLPRLLVTPWTVFSQAPLSVGFLRQGYYRGGAISFSRGSSWPSILVIQLQQLFCFSLSCAIVHTGPRAKNAFPPCLLTNSSHSSRPSFRNISSVRSSHIVWRLSPQLLILSSHGPNTCPEHSTPSPHHSHLPDPQEKVSLLRTWTRGFSL